MGTFLVYIIQVGVLPDVALLALHVVVAWGEAPPFEPYGIACPVGSCIPVAVGAGRVVRGHGPFMADGNARRYIRRAGGTVGAGRCACHAG